MPPPNQEQHNLDGDDRDKVIRELQAALKSINSRVHQATSAAPEIYRILEETQNSLFTAKIYKKPIRHARKLRFSTYDGSSDLRQYMIAFTIAMGRAHFSPDERDAGCCQLFV